MDMLHTAQMTEAVSQPVSTVQMQVAPAPSYRCAGCGELLHFNSLSTTCRCLDECYSESPGSDASR